MKVTKEVNELLKTKDGQIKLIAIKVCELVEILKKQPVQSDHRSLFQWIFGS